MMNDGLYPEFSNHLHQELSMMIKNNNNSNNLQRKNERGDQETIRISRHSLRKKFWRHLKLANELKVPKISSEPLKSFKWFWTRLNGFLQNYTKFCVFWQNYFWLLKTPQKNFLRVLKKFLELSTHLQAFRCRPNSFFFRVVKKDRREFHL